MKLKLFERDISSDWRCVDTQISCNRENRWRLFHQEKCEGEDNIQYSFSKYRDVIRVAQEKSAGEIGWEVSARLKF